MGDDSVRSPLAPLSHRSVTPPVLSLDPTNCRRGHTISNSDPKIEDLFAYPSVRIVCFSAGSALDSKDPFRENEEVGTLPWSTALERVIAVGPLRIYRAPGSVAFLNCGNVIQAIFPKSKCWCVDDASTKFVLQIRKPQYWRIEISNSNQNNLHPPSELKRILSQILQFEITACPFQRTFTVELPEIATNPVKKKPWKPVAISRQTDSSCTSGSMLEIDNEEIYLPATLDGNRPCQKTVRDNEATDLTPRDNSKYTYLDVLSENPDSSVDLQVPHLSITRPQLTVITSPPLKTPRAQSPVRRTDTPDSRSSDFSSMGSFHSVESWHSPISPLPPSPNPTSPSTYPYPHDNISLTKRPHKHSTSETTDTPETPCAWDATRAYNTLSVTDYAEDCLPSPPRTPALVDDIGDDLDEEHFEILTPPTITYSVRHRLTTRANSPCRRRALAGAISQGFPAANISFSSRQRPKQLQVTQSLPTTIIRKTCEILLSPPSHLVYLMLDIASKIAAGEWKGIVFGSGEQGEKIIGQWDYEDHNAAGDEWGEDDYGISLGGNQAMREGSKVSSGSSWEID